MSPTDPSQPNRRPPLSDPLRNKGTAFTLEERRALRIEGLLPYQVQTLDQQVARVRVKFDVSATPLAKHVMLRAQQDRNETLFHAFVQRNLRDTMPIVYTPTVGEACQRFSHIYRHPRGMFLAYPDRGRIDEILAQVDREIRAVVVTDGERILGLGDQGIGGMGIPIGKLALYTACAGLDPATTLPVLLDVGTNNPDLLADPLYMGWRHERIDGDDYRAFVDEFVEAFAARFPRALLQWEDFATRHASTLLHRHRERVLSFNDDIQGTAAVALAAIRGGVAQSGTTFEDQRFMFVGAGSAGTGIARMIVDALRSTPGFAGDPPVFLVDNVGLIHDGRTDLTDDQRDLACPAAAAAGWEDGAANLTEIVTRLEPSVLVGVSGQPRLFTREIVTRMAARVDRPIIMPLSNPTDRAEADPADLMTWSDGRAIVATGSPFEVIGADGVAQQVAQANNVYVFPGIALGALAVSARVVTDEMFHAAAGAVAAACASTGSVLPDLVDIREVSRQVALAVANAAVESGAADQPENASVPELIDGLAWVPQYQDFQR